MNRVWQRKETGQSIPLIALMIVILFGMVGLSVDVGNTYAEQRTVVRASNAAAIAAMDAVIKGYNDTGVNQIIRESLKSNGLNLDGGDGLRNLRAYYMDIDGREISNCQIGQCGTVPTDVNYIEVKVDGNVSTFFARVVGTNTLPVNATAFAGRCPPTNGVLPIAVWSGDLDANGFIPPQNVTQTELVQQYGTYKDANYPAGKHWRRIFMKDTPPGGNGNFSFLSWTGANDAKTLAAAISGDGTLADGFAEVSTWPKSSSSVQPANYPLAPGLLTVNDWMYTTPGMKMSKGDGVYSGIWNHITKRTLVMLPIVDEVAGQGANFTMKMSRLGAFYIVDPTPADGQSSGGFNDQGGKNAYIDLVYLGPANETACLVTNVDPPDVLPGTATPPTQVLPVRIPMQVNPRWAGVDQPAQPIAYQLVVDVSGSMSFDFRGNGTIGGSVGVEKDTTGGKNYRCEWSSTDTTYAYNDTCQGGPNSSWWEYKMRRIYITKSAIDNFIDALGPYDTMRYTAFASGSLSGNVLTVPSSGFTNDKATLKTSLRTLGSYSNDPYRTSGGTPGPQAIQKAKSVIASAPITAPNGQPYRKVIIYLTDGVANVFINGSQNVADDICGSMTQMQRINTPDPCQVGYSSKYGMYRPISEMVNQANQIKSADPEVQIYVIALAGVATDGLQNVASSPSMMYKANEPGFVDSILNAIRERASGSTCLAQGGNEYLDRIAPANHSDFTGSYALPSNVYGRATIYNANGTTVVATADIVHDQFSGKLGIEASLPPGNYQLEAWIGYKGPDQPQNVSRVYQSLSWNKITSATRLPFSIDANSSLNDVRVLPDVFVDLQANQNVCPTK